MLSVSSPVAVIKHSDRKPLQRTRVCSGSSSRGQSQQRECEAPGHGAAKVKKRAAAFSEYTAPFL